MAVEQAFRTRGGFSRIGQMLKSLVRQTSHYSLAGILATVAGLVSFPIVTRVLSVEDYGLLSLMGVSLAFLIAIAKAGSQHGIVRYYAEHRQRAGGGEPAAFHSTVVFGGLILAPVVVVMAWLLAWAFRDELGQLGISPALVAVLGVMAVAGVLKSVAINTLRAQEKSGLVSKVTVGAKLLAVGATIGAILLIEPSAEMFYYALFAVELVVVGYLFRKTYGGTRLALSSADWDLGRRLVAFGLPLVGFELSQLILNIGDRYVIAGVLDSKAVGIYSAAYNLTDYVTMAVTVPIYEAVRPMGMRIWAEQGQDALQQFLSRTFHLYFLVAVPVVLGLSLVGDSLLVLLVGERYAEGADVIPWVIAGKVLNGGIVIFSIGLYVRDRSHVVLVLVAAAALINLLLNLILVPVAGIKGAAMATLIAYGVLAVMTVIVVRPVFRIRIPFRPVGRVILFGLIMAASVSLVGMGTGIYWLVAQVVVGAAVYGGLVACLDPIGQKFRDRVLAKVVGQG